MKNNIHPTWYEQAKVTCTCGNVFTVGSTMPEIQIEICSKCHPFFTGEMKYVDTAGRVEKFQKKMASTDGQKLLKKKERRLIRRIQSEKEEAERPKSFREMLTKTKSEKKS